MTSIAIDLNPSSPTFRDALVVNGDFVLVDGATEIQQNILQTLSIYFGEWFLNNSIGIDYFNQVLVKNPSQAAINAIFLSQISAVPGVQSINSSVTPNFMTRQVFLKFSVTTTSGVVSYEGLV